MLIDSLDIVHSGRVKSTIVHGPSQDRFITQWAQLLSSVGWSTAATLHATASVTYPLGAPVTDGITVLPKTIVGCNTPPGILTIGTQEYSLFDPFKQAHGTTTDCHFVGEGLTPGDTLNNLKTAVDADGIWSADVTFNGGTNYTFTITAVAPGPIFNEILVTGNIISGSTTTYGGGYVMQSYGGSSSTQYSCTMTAANRDGAGDDYLNGILKFDFDIHGQTVTYQLLNGVQGTLGFMGALGVGGVGQYTIIANPYGFAVFDFPHDTTTHIFRAISLFCMAPYFPVPGEDVPPSELFVPAYAVFIVGPNQIGGSPAWRNGPSTMSLDANPFQTFSSNPTARLLALRSPQNPMLTLYNTPLFVCPYVQFGSFGSNADPAWVVGKVWDCALVTDEIPVGANLDGEDFLTIGGSVAGSNQTVVTFMMDAGTTHQFFPLGQSARCASAPGHPGDSALGNTAR